MADAVTSQTLVDGERNVVMKFTNISDGTGESAVLKVDVSALQGSPERVSIQEVWWFTDGMEVDVLWDATSPVVALTIDQNDSGYMDFRSFGGIKNNAGSGITGDIKFTTTGAASGDRYTIILSMHKQ